MRLEMSMVISGISAAIFPIQINQVKRCSKIVLDVLEDGKKIGRENNCNVRLTYSEIRKELKTLMNGILKLFRRWNDKVLPSLSPNRI